MTDKVHDVSEVATTMHEMVVSHSQFLPTMLATEPTSLKGTDCL